MSGWTEPVLRESELYAGRVHERWREDYETPRYQQIVDHHQEIWRRVDVLMQRGFDVDAARTLATYQVTGEWSLDWIEEQCGGCEFYVPLAGPLGSDWGVCTNPQSPHDRRVLFEHEGCPHHSILQAEQAQLPEDTLLAQILTEAKTAREEHHANRQQDPRYSPVSYTETRKQVYEKLRHLESYGGTGYFQGNLVAFTTVTPESADWSDYQNALAQLEQPVRLIHPLEWENVHAKEKDH